MSTSYTQIEKLDESNYETWKIQMRSVLVHQSLWDYVSGTATEPDKSKDKDGFEKHVRHDEKALASIILHVKPSQLLHIKSCEKAKEAWDKLMAVYQSKAPARKVSLFKQLINLKMADSSPIQTHLNSFFEVTGKLEEAGIKLPKELISIILLSSLPKEYENFVVAMESRDDLPEVDILKNKLIEDGLRRSSNVEKPDETAFAMKPKHKNKKFHSKNSSNYTRDRTCYNCGQSGHFIADCRMQKKERSGNSKKSTAFGLLEANLSAGNLKNKVWIFDSGSTSHMCCDKSLFSTLQEHQENIQMPNNQFVKSSGIGEVILKTPYSEVKLQQVLYVPDLHMNFISLSKATVHGMVTVLKSNYATIRNRNNRKLLQAKLFNNLFIFEMEEQEKVCALKSPKINEFKLWHERFGHLNQKSLSQMISNGRVRGIELDKNQEKFDCETCLKAKFSSLPFESSTSKCKEVLEIVTSDICGPMQTTSLGGSRYFALFIDVYSRRMFVYFLKKKNEVFGCFKIFKARVENETNKKIKIFRSDNGGEYVNAEFTKFLNESGIQHQLTVAHTPQQNGISERANRTIVEMARSLLISSNLPNFMWAEAVNTAVYLRNRSETKSLDNKTPFEAWFGRTPNVHHLKVFGCKAIMLNKSPGRSKFSSKGIECIMVGYSTESKAYRVYIPDQRKIVKTRDIKFLENQEKEDNTVIEVIETEKPLQHEEESDGEENFEDAEEGEIESSVIVISDESSPENKRKPAQKVNKGGRPKIVRTGTRGRPRKVFNSANALETEIENPNTVSEALASQHKEEWLDAMKVEYGNLMRNDTWELVNLPKNRKALKSRWVFNIKRDKNGEVDKFKARLVAKGCSQKYGIDFQETFSPVVRYSSIRILLALAVEYGLEIHQMDVVSAYLNGELKDEIYMQQPENFVDAKSPEKVCKLKKGLYGLKQSGREWNHKLDKILKSIGFRQSSEDSCIYILKTQNGYVIIAVFVDDLLILGTSRKIIEDVKQKISLEIETVDKGLVDYFLGMQIEVDAKSKQIHIHQKQFIQNLLESWRMENCRKVSTPLDPGQKFQKCVSCEDCEKADVKSYQSLIGSLSYLSLSTRPDISYAVNQLSQFNVNPHQEHLVAAKHILKYLNSTIDLKLTYKKTGAPIEGFSDADWGGNYDRKSHTGYCFILASGTVVWETKKQQSVALSSTEAEYMAMSSASKEAVYLKKLLQDLGYPELVEKPIKMHGDNLSAIQLIKNPVYHSRSKHIDIRVHYVREVFQNNIIELQYCSTNEMVADILTKVLTKQKHQKLSKLLGMVEVQLEG